MRWNEIVRDYLTFSRKDSIGIVIILIILSLVIISPIFFKSKNKNNSTTSDNSWVVAVKQLEQTDNSGKDSDRASIHEYEYDRRKNNYTRSSNSLFDFDPNQISADEWKKLGLRDKTIRTIQNYLSKGGRFKRKEDLQKVYGLHQDEYERLEPYVKIPEPSADKKNEMPDKNNFPVVTRSFVKAGYSAIDINIADTSTFISLPGIGSKLAVRIVNFRERLGGFYSIEQISETYGLPDSTYQKIKPNLKLDNSEIKKININTASFDDLKSHPYIRYSIANAIIAYRKEHGNFSAISDLKKIMVVSDEVYQKITPYLTLTF